MISVLTSLFALNAVFSTVAAAPANAPVESRQKATACCNNQGNCNTVSGTTDSGLKWCYGYEAGNTVWTTDDATVAKCLTNLHYIQDDACITTTGSECDTGIGPDVVCAHSTFLYGPYQLSSDDSIAIQAAMDDAAANGLMFSFDNTNSNGYIQFTHVADNGSGIVGLEIYNQNLC